MRFMKVNWESRLLVCFAAPGSLMFLLWKNTPPFHHVSNTMCFLCVCIRSDRLPVVRVDYWPHSGEGAPLQNKFVAVILPQMPVHRLYRPFSTSCPQWRIFFELTNVFSIHEKQCHLDEIRQCWVITTYAYKPLPPSRSYSQRSSCAFFHNPPLKIRLFRISLCHWKKTNVCLLSPILTSSLSPLSPPAPPVLVAKRARTTLHAAIQWQPQRPQPY